jgi:hypothetical protein
MKIRITFFLLQLIVFACCTGCTQRRVVCHEAQSIHEDKETTDKAYQTIIHDLDALHDELKTAERVVRTSMDPKVYKTLNRAKQAANAKNYEEARALYRQTLELARDHLVDDATLVAFRQALVNLERRLDGNSSCKEAWADLLALAVKQRLRRIVIPDFEIGPPKTLIDACDYFKQASRDYEDPKIPIEQRGVSFVLKLRDDGTAGHLASEGEDPFAAPTNSNAPVIPKLSARCISLYDAITLVCDTTGYMFSMRGGFVSITPREDDVEPMRLNENSK